MARLLLASWVLLACGALTTSAVDAHPLAPSLLEIVESEPGRAAVRWKTPAQKAPGAVLRPVVPSHCRQDGQWRTEAVDTALLHRWQVDCEAPLTGSVVAVQGIASSRASVILRVALADGRTFNTVLTADAPSFLVPAQEHPLDVVRSYLVLGMEHILTGIDHLLFVLALLLLVAGWRRLALTVTAFTVGHSVTLSLAVLGVVAVPSGPAEALIALSILVVAVELARAPDAPASLVRRFPWAMAFAFGLLHGLGFAGALTEVGLPNEEIPLALFSFNLGIEAGQLVFCALCLGLFAGLRAFWAAGPFPWTKVAAYPIGTLAAFWLVERTAAVW